MGRLRGSFIAGCLFLAAVGSAQTQPICNLVQITNSSSTPSGPQVVNGFPAIDASGNRIAFSSNADLVGQNGDGNQEIFLWDAATGLSQITRTTGGLESLVPAINAAGTRIAFSSTANLVGSNGDGSREIFLWDAATGFTQITNTTSRDNRLPDLNGDGNRIAFSSTADLVGSNGDGNYEIFLWDAATGFTQITNTVGGNSTGPELNAAGNRIALTSNADPLGSNVDGNPEIFLWDASAGLSQITETDSLGSSQPTLNAAGNRITFVSNNDLTGGNGDRSSEIFLWDAATGFTQVTVNAPAITLFSPSINAAGDRIAFFALNQREEVFLWDEATGVSRLLNSPGSSNFPSINAAGNRIAFSSDANPLGSNGDGNFEIFLAACGSLIALEESIPTVSPLGLAALAVLLGLAAAWTLRRRRASIQEDAS